MPIYEILHTFLLIAKISTKATQQNCFLGTGGISTLKSNKTSNSIISTSPVNIQRGYSTWVPSGARKSAITSLQETKSSKADACIKSLKWNVIHNLTKICRLYYRNLDEGAINSAPSRVVSESCSLNWAIKRRKCLLKIV